MSDESTPEQPAAAATAVVEKPAAPAEPPFSVDALTNCTTRFTRKAWNIFLAYKEDLNKIRTQPVRATLEAQTHNGAEELHRLLMEAGVHEISRKDKVISMTTTFEILQTVVKHAEVAMVDIVEV